MSKDIVSFSAAARRNSEVTARALQTKRETYMVKKQLEYPRPVEISLEGELKTAVENDLCLARLVLADLGYPPSETADMLPSLGQIHFYSQPADRGDGVIGSVANVGNWLDIQCSASVFSQDRQRIDPVLWHEFGHWPAERVYSRGFSRDSIRLVAFGFDRKKNFYKIMDRPYFQPDNDDTFFRGILREPLAHLFGYYCVEKSRSGSPYPVVAYYRETAFVVTFLTRLAAIRSTSFFEEFSRLYRSFNSRDYSYFKTLRDDLTKYWEGADLSQRQARQRATIFVSALNNIHSEYGRDSLLVYVRGGGGDIVDVTFQYGAQLDKLAVQADFQDEYQRCLHALTHEGLTLDGVVTVMTNDSKRLERTD